MALLPARRNGTLTRPGSQPEGRWDPFAEFEDLYQRMGQLMTSAFEGMWQPLAQAWSPLADLSETDDAYVAEVELPGVKKDDISIEVTGQELAITGEYSEGGAAGRALRRSRRGGPRSPPADRSACMAGRACRAGPSPFPSLGPARPARPVPRHAGWSFPAAQVRQAGRMCEQVVRG